MAVKMITYLTQAKEQQKAQVEQKIGQISG
jgi:hypothetical protein